LKAEYFPDEELLNMKLKMGASFTWQSILGGVQCLKKVCIWRIGDGNKVNIYIGRCAWIPSRNSRKVLTPKGQVVLTHVNELIHPSTGQWDEAMVRNIVWPIDAMRILQIPLSDGMEDFMEWQYSNLSIFSVRSAYHVEWDHQHRRKMLRTNRVGSQTR
jgi:hypothetical protein